MTQQSLFHESIYDALRDVVNGTGGFKRVGSDLWPSLPADKAGRDLSDCLNASNDRKLSLTELIWLLKRGRNAGIHTAMHYIASECDYEAPRPVNPESETQRLQREFIAATETLSRLAQKIEARRTA